MTQFNPNHTLPPILDIDYSQFFQDVSYNGKNLNTQERLEFIDMVDQDVAELSSGLPMLYAEIQRLENLNDDYHNTCRIVYSVYLFSIITMCDCSIAGKCFIQADSDYEKRYMRGKMKVILNEGFKKLYGYADKNKKNSEWGRLSDIMQFFPSIINSQYQQLTSHLEKLSKTSYWWKDERNYETHIDAINLYAYRQEPINESKEMMESIYLINSLRAVNHFITNIHTCITNNAVLNYQKR